MSSLTFPRVVILLSYLLSAACGWYVYRQSAELEELRRQTSVDVRLMASRILTRAYEMNHLSEQVSKEGFKGGQEAPDVYIRSCATHPKVRIGQVNIDTDTRGVQKGIVDRRYTIVPMDKQDEFPLGKIANFLYTLEEGSRRVRVTHLRITPGRGSRQPGDVLDGTWQFECELTSRQAEEQ